MSNLDTHYARRVLVTGSRDWPDPDAVWAALDAVLADTPADATLTVVHGACRTGADLEADRWAIARRAETGRDIAVERHVPDWARLGPAAGPIRNNRMVNRGADLCLAFIHNDSRGESQCAEGAQNSLIPTTVHRSES